MVFFMSSATVGQFVVFGMLDLKYASFYGCVGIIGAIAGTKGAKARCSPHPVPLLAPPARPLFGR